MEISGNKYLHKKFKKQSSCSLSYNVEGNKVHQHSNSSSSVTDPSEAVEKTQECEENSVVPSKLDVENELNIYKDNKIIDCVPNYKSTNCAYSLAKTFKTENVNRMNVIIECQSSISNLASTNNINAIEHETNVKSLSNTISKIETILPSSALLGNDLKENHFSFDIKSSNISNSIEKSSNIDVICSKYSLLSERKNSVNVFQSNDTKNYGRNEGEILSSESVEKKQNSAESTGGKYVCTYCNLACSKPSVLQKHIRAHTNERPYPCVSCGFSFKTRSNLYKHCRSRTHANRVMGNKHNQSSVDCTDVDSPSERNDEKIDITEEPSIRTSVEYSDIAHKSENTLTDTISSDHSNVWEQKQKPYKPKFHTAKLFFEENKKRSEVDVNKFSVIEKKNEPSESVHIKTNTDLLKLRINELISKNNSILSCDDTVLRKRSNENSITDNFTYHEQQIVWPQTTTDFSKTEEPLNLTAKNRKRCLSDSENSQKSLIKELLLKNLSSDPNLQCQYCRMIFQTVPELEMHKLKYCSAYNKGNNNVRYARSSSVNVASILTHNKNAFDSIPHMQHSAFSLKSPGPFLGKTRLIESDRNEKYRTFSFDDNVIMNHTQLDSPSFGSLTLNSPSYPLSPHIKKNSIKLFGGEVKITQTSGETRSYKIESENINKISSEPPNFIEFGTKMSENLVIKSSLQSGGTVLQNKSSYTPKLDSLPSPNLLRYDSANIASSKLNLSILNENKFSYDKVSGQNDRLLTFANQKALNTSPNPRELSCIDNTHNLDTKSDENEKDLFKTNLINFSQKAIKLITPNLKPPNLSVPGLSVPLLNSEKIYSPIETEKDKQTIDNLNFAKKQISLHQKMFDISSPNLYNPVNLLVNGKVVRYVPGIPGPVADASLEMPVVTTKVSIKTPKETLKSPRPLDELQEARDVKSATPTNLTKYDLSNDAKFDNKGTPVVDQHEIRTDLKSQVLIKIKTDYEKRRELEKSEVNKMLENKITPLSISVSSSDKTSKEEVKKFVRPNSLALKPSSVSFKSHHGLTPTMFNQALISPDTPRVAKKYCQQYLNGNYFSYLGLKSSTKSVYCTLNKTQPFYVKHFKKLSMYSEWRQQESKIDSLSVSCYDSRQRQSKYTMAGVNKADLTVHSSYKFITSESCCSKDESNVKSSSICGGYESNEDYTYIRGRGRGRYVCDQCGIRCKKPSMLKKHIRTHSDDRPYTCQQCNFSFKTKGNLTKHMKSKAHSKKYAETSSTSTQNSITSSDSDESDAESSDESTRLQEHEAAHCLLSLSQKSTITQNIHIQENSTSSSSSNLHFTEFSSFLKDNKFLKNPDQITQVSNTNFAKNKIMDENVVSFSASKHFSGVLPINTTSGQDNISQYLGKSSVVRPLTYPYQQTHLDLENKSQEIDSTYKRSSEIKQNKDIPSAYQENIQKMHVKSVDKKNYDSINNKVEEISRSSPVIIRNVLSSSASPRHDFSLQNLEGNLPANVVFRKRKLSVDSNLQTKLQRSEESQKPMDLSSSVISISGSSALDLSSAPSNAEYVGYSNTHYKSDNNPRIIVNSPTNFESDVSSNEPVYEQLRTTTAEKIVEPVSTYTPEHRMCFSIASKHEKIVEQSYLNYASQVQRNNIFPTGFKITNSDITSTNMNQDIVIFNKKQNDSLKSVDEQMSQSSCERQLDSFTSDAKSRHSSFSESNSSETFSQNSDINERMHKIQEEILPFTQENPNVIYKPNISTMDSKDRKISDCEQDQSAMQTLAEIAIKQMKTEKNIMAKNVASEYLKFALKNECNSNSEGNGSESGIKKFVGSNKDTNELIVKPEENKNCSICSKNFSKPSQLRLHMNIHYLERPFRCESCAVSFRTKGHLQKHERSTTHHNKLSTSPALSSSEPRPFKCSDCNIAFRIHGHLAKHLRSKMHIMKLECLAKIPFGLYAELERANSLLTEINTTDGDLCLESLKILARKLFSNNPNKLDQLANVPESRDS